MTFYCLFKSQRLTSCFLHRVGSKLTRRDDKTKLVEQVPHNVTCLYLVFAVKRSCDVGEMRKA